MKKCGKFLSLLLAAAMCLAVSALAAEPAEVPARGDIVVLFTNDVHCAVDGGLGYAGLAAYRDEMKKTTDYVTLVDAGDATQGGPMGSLSQGAYILDIMDQVGYDVAVPGNHEFDYGFPAPDKAPKCGYVCCNLLDLKTGNTVYEPYKLISYGGTEVAYVGIDTPETLSKDNPSAFENADGSQRYGFCEGGDGAELYRAVQNTVDAARAAGADYVVAVGHCGVSEQSAPWRSTDIIAHVSGLTAFLDGHSHSVIACRKVADKDGKTVLLSSTGTKFANLGRLVIKAGGSVSTDLVSKDSWTARDAATDAFVKSLQAKNQELLGQTIAVAAVPLTTLNPDGTRAVRSAETNLGDLCADAFRVVGNADIGVVNGGGVRADIAAGSVSYGDLIGVFPFNNALCVMEVTGQQILDALEMAARSSPGENGGFLQVSGLSCTIDATIPSSVTVSDQGEFTGVAGARRVRDVLVGGEPLEPGRTYRLASHDYLLKNGGDGMNMFQADKEVTSEPMLDNEVLIRYITLTLGGVIPDSYAASQGRITVVREPFADVADGDWYYGGVVYTYEARLFTGTDTTVFSPADSMTRGQAALVVWRLAGSPEPGGTGAFSDVDSGAYYAKAVQWAAENGVAVGAGAGAFCPEAPVSRQELAVLLYRYAALRASDTAQGGTDIREFTNYDSIAPYAREAMGWAGAAGLIQGMGDGTLRPGDAATRGQAAVILMRFDKLIKAADAA